MTGTGTTKQLTIDRRPRVWGVVVASGLALAIAAGTATAQNAAPGGSGSAPSAGSGSSLLNRNKTKLKPVTPAANNGSKPGAGLKPTGRKTPSPASAAPATPTSGSPRYVVARRDGAQPVLKIDGNNNDAQPMKFERGVFELRDEDASAKDGMIQFGPIVKLSNGEPRSLRDGLQEAVRNGNLPTSNDDLYNLTRPEDIDTARVEQLRHDYHEKGYMEVKLDESHMAFVKAGDWSWVNKGADILRDRYGIENSVPEIDPRLSRIGNDLYHGGDSRYGYGSDDTFSSLRRMSCCGPCGGGASISEVSRRVDPFVTMEDEKRGSDESRTLRNQAWDAIWDDRETEGLAAFKQHLEADPEDRETAREYALALLHSGKIADGISKMYDAYRLNPMLASTPLDSELLPNGDEELRSLSQRVVTMANSSKGPEASVAAAVLFQMQGKSDAARRMIDRAKGKGMDERIGMEFGAALAPAK